MLYQRNAVTFGHSSYTIHLRGHAVKPYNWIVPLGPAVDGFERDLKEFMGGGKEVVALSNGTAAVHPTVKTVGRMPCSPVTLDGSSGVFDPHCVWLLATALPPCTSR